MRPALPKSGIAVIVPATARSLRVGDIALVIHGDFWAIHRVVRKRRQNGVAAIQTKGDSVCELDPWIPDDAGSAVFGRIVRVEDTNGRERNGLVRFALSAFPSRMIAALSLHGRRLQKIYLRRRRPPFL